MYCMLIINLTLFTLFFADNTDMSSTPALNHFCTWQRRSLVLYYGSEFTINPVYYMHCTEYMLMGAPQVYR